jgi:hypothetical protein
MYHSIIPITDNHNPIIVEGETDTRVLLFNAGPAIVEAQVWLNWKGKINGDYTNNSAEANFSLELRPGNQKVVSGSLIRIAIKEDRRLNEKHFAAVGATFLYWPIN